MVYLLKIKIDQQDKVDAINKYVSDISIINQKHIEMFVFRSLLKT